MQNLFYCSLSHWERGRGHEIKMKRSSMNCERRRMQGIRLKYSTGEKSDHSHHVVQWSNLHQICVTLPAPSVSSSLQSCSSVVPEKCSFACIDGIILQFSEYLMTEQSHSPGIRPEKDMFYHSVMTSLHKSFVQLWTILLLLWSCLNHRCIKFTVTIILRK